MKRYRVIPYDFDFRARHLTLEIKEEWEPAIKEQHIRNKAAIEQELLATYGSAFANEKKQNFIDLGPTPLSIIAFHNLFFEQTRTAFIMGAYYPALTGICALGERVLNHLILLLRQDFTGSREYKRIARKDSFDNWNTAIEMLRSWDCLRSETADVYQDLMDKRHKAIHFRPETDHNDRELSLEAIHTFQSIIELQFAAWGQLPWFLTEVAGEIYIKESWETHPFVKRVYLPNCPLVSPYHRVLEISPHWKVEDEKQLPGATEIDDSEFAKLRNERRAR